MSRYRIQGLFSNFDEAFNAINDIKQNAVSGVKLDDVTMMSPIEHPDIEEVLGERPSPVPLFTLSGALFGLVFGFLFLATAEANFLVQPQGGKPVIPLPSNFVINYEMLILFGVLSTIAGFLICARMLTPRSGLYSEKISLDQVGVVVELDEQCMEPVKDLFGRHQVLEIREEVVA